MFVRNCHWRLPDSPRRPPRPLHRVPVYCIIRVSTGAQKGQSGGSLLCHLEAEVDALPDSADRSIRATFDFQSSTQTAEQQSGFVVRLLIKDSNSGSPVLL